MCVRAHSGASKWGRVQSLECIRAYNSKPTKLALSWPYKPCASEQRQNGVGFLFLSKNSARFPSPTQVSTQSPTIHRHRAQSCRVPTHSVLTCRRLGLAGVDRDTPARAAHLTVFFFFSLRLLTRDLSKVADLDSRSGLSRGPDGLVVGFRRFGIVRWKARHSIPFQRGASPCGRKQTKSRLRLFER